MATSKKTKVYTSAHKETGDQLKPSIKEHFITRYSQKKLSEKNFSETNPSKVTEIYWIYASRKKGKYFKPTINCGKWLVFVNISNVDMVWKNIKLATENGLLGDSSKVATAKTNPNATKENLKVICIYTYDYTDKADVMRIREELRKIGIINKIPYKTDNATRQGLYEVKGNTRISVYFE